MKRALAAVLIPVLGAMPVLAGITLKFQGGFAVMPGGDYNRAVDGWNGIYEASWDSVSGKFSKLSGAFFFGGEVLFKFAPRLSLGLGGGTYGVSRTDSVEYSKGVIEGQMDVEPGLSVIPITLNLHYGLPLRPGLNLDLYAGPGLYLTAFDLDLHSQVNEFLVDNRYTFKARQAVFGFQAGFDLEYDLSPRVALVLGGAYRYAEMSEVRGDFTDDQSWIFGSSSETGPDHYAWAFQRNIRGRDYDDLIFDSAAPSKADISGARKARFNVGGLQASAGVKVRF
jgi:hypothetical protein